MKQSTLFDLAPYTVKKQAPPEDAELVPEFEDLPYYQTYVLDNIYLGGGASLQLVQQWAAFYTVLDWWDLLLSGFVDMNNYCAVINDRGIAYLKERDLI